MLKDNDEEVSGEVEEQCGTKDVGCGLVHEFLGVLSSRAERNMHGGRYRVSPVRH